MKENSQGLEQNKSIARLIVGAMTIDGSLDKKEQDEVIASVSKLGMSELIAELGLAIENDDGSFNLFAECKALLEHLGARAAEVTDLVFTIVAEVVASDEFVSEREASYLSSLAKSLKLPIPTASAILRKVLAERRSKLEISADDVDASINKTLKELLSFEDAAEFNQDSLASTIQTATDNEQKNLVSREEAQRALAVLGLDSAGTFEEANKIWKDSIQNLGLSKLAELGETYVSAALHNIVQINEAYKVLLALNTQSKSANEKSAHDAFSSL